MDHLSEAQLATLRRKLEDEAQRLRGRIAEATEQVADDGSEPEPEDIEDSAARDAGRFTAKQMLDRWRGRLEKVEAALTRMDVGTYGICEETDEQIPYRRLELEPTARFTVEAQAEHEREGEVGHAHAEEPTGY